MAGERKAAILFLIAAVVNSLSLQSLFHSFLRPLDPIFGVFFLASMLYAIALLVRRYRVVAKVFLYGCVVGLLFEILGVNFCIPFGCYHYVRLPGILCGVPPGVVLMWGVYSTTALLACTSLSKTMVIPRAVLATVAIDVAMEPVMVSGGCWVWEKGWGPWFNEAPLSNYIGWGVVATTVFLLAKVEKEHLPRDYFFIPCYLVYLAVWWFTPYTRVSAVITSILLAIVGLMPWSYLKGLMCFTSRRQL